MMEQAISDRCLMDTSRFRVVDLKGLIGAMAVSMIDEVGMELEKVVHEAERKGLDIPLLALAADELLPGIE